MTASPEELVKQAGEIKDVLLGDDFYKGMRGSTEELFKPSADANILTYTVATTAKSATDALITTAETAKNAVNYVSNTSWTQMAHDGSDLAGKTYDTAKNVGAETLNAAIHPIDTAGKALTAASDAVSTAGDRAVDVAKATGEMLGDAYEGVKGIGSQAASGAKQLASSAASYIKGWFS
jgi:hypothetical protein